MNLPKLDYKYFIKNGLVNSSANIIEAILSFLFQTFLLIYLTTNEFAKYQWLIVFFSYFMFFTMPLFSQYAQYSFHKYKERAWFSLHKFKISVQLFFGISVFILSFILNVFQTELKIAALLIILGNFKLYNDYFKVRDQFKEITFNKILRFIVYFSVASVSVILYQEGFLSF